MGLFDKIRGEFVDIIEWLDPSNDTMVYRFERYQQEIKYGAKLTVRESQVAVFINEGQLADVFNPGMYTLETQNMPVLTTLKGWKYGFNSPFKAEVYFINTKQFTDQKWGTKNPVMLRDVEFGPVRLRAFGSYALKVKDPMVFIRNVVGTDGNFSADEITNQLRNIMVARFSDAVAESKIPVLDLASNYDELGKLLETRINPEMESEYGLNIAKFLVENISLPPEVEAALDKRSSMGIIGNLGAYAQFQAANSMEKAAENPGGSASAGVGMGMGFAMANQMGNMFQQQQQPQQSPAPGHGGPSVPPPVPQTQVYLAVNGTHTGPFNEGELMQMIQSGALKPDHLVWKNGMSSWEKASTLPEVNKLFGPVPPPVPPH